MNTNEPRCAKCDGIFTIGHECSPEIREKVRDDAIMNGLYRRAEQDGMSYTEMLEKTVIFMLNIKDDLFQERLQEKIRSTESFLHLAKDLPFGLVGSEAYKRDQRLKNLRASRNVDSIATL